jgi:hypothetical protein
MSDRFAGALVSDPESKGSRFPGGETAPVGSNALAFARGC